MYVLKSIIVFTLFVGNSFASEDRCRDLTDAVSKGVVKVEILDIEVANAYFYKIRHVKSKHISISGELDDGNLTFSVRTRDKETGKHLKHYIRAKEIFSLMMNHFGKNVVTVTAQWYPEYKVTNLKMYKKNIESGMSNERAIFATWTGRRMKEYGYNKILKLEIDKKDNGEITKRECLEFCVSSS